MDEMRSYPHSCSLQSGRQSGLSEDPQCAHSTEADPLPEVHAMQPQSDRSGLRCRAGPYLVPKSEPMRRGPLGAQTALGDAAAVAPLAETSLRSCESGKTMAWSATRLNRVQKGTHRWSACRTSSATSSTSWFSPDLEQAGALKSRAQRNNCRLLHTCPSRKRSRAQSSKTSSGEVRPWHAWVP